MRSKYLKVVEWSDEDECYIGDCPAFSGKSCHGDDEVEVYRELCTIVDEWIEIYKKEDTPLPEPDACKVYSGRFNIRMTPEEHKLVSIRASVEGVSLNSYCVQKSLN